jgi:hypothetical protein
VRHSTKSPKGPFAFDLHVLGTPPAFVLSQDQTLKFDSLQQAPIETLASSGPLSLMLLRSCSKDPFRPTRPEQGSLDFQVTFDLTVQRAPNCLPILLSKIQPPPGSIGRA